MPTLFPALLKTCILLTTNGQDISLELVPPSDFSSPCKLPAGHKTGAMRHLIIRRSSDLKIWKDFVEGEFPEGALMTIFENADKQPIYYRVESFNP